MSFADIIGQDRQIMIIKRALKGDRVPHAYLFLGERGIGKLLTAFTLAKALNCLTETTDACEECRSCKKTDQGNHPDIALLQPEGSFIKINQIRELQRTLQYKSYEGRKKVRIIQDAEKMNLSASNALLKTLEEPPPDTVLILITMSPHMLLPTIRSRCQRVRFQPIPTHLIAQTIKEKQGMDHDTALRAASLARGSLGRAYELAETEMLDHKREYIKKINALPANDIDSAFKLAEEMSKERDELIQILDIFETWYRDLLVFKEGCSLHRLINLDFTDEIKKMSQRFSVADLMEKLRIIHDTQSALLSNSNVRLTMEVMLTKISQDSARATP